MAHTVSICLCWCDKVVLASECLSYPLDVGLRGINLHVRIGVISTKVSQLRLSGDFSATTHFKVPSFNPWAPSSCEKLASSLLRTQVYPGLS